MTDRKRPKEAVQQKADLAKLVVIAYHLMRCLGKLKITYLTRMMSVAWMRINGRPSNFASNSSMRTQPEVLAAGDSTSKTACENNSARITRSCSQREPVS
jgi:hypothetical protein